MNICEYCNSTFVSKNAMVAHQKRARYCLDIQITLNPDLSIENFGCQYCNKKFTRKGEKDKHESICTNTKLLYQKIIDMKEEYDNKIDEKNIEISNLKLKLESEISKRDIYKELHDNSRHIVDKLASQPKNVNNTINNIPTLNINSEKLSEAAITDFSKDLFLQGQAGVAKFFINYLKNSNNGVVPFVVTDKSREVLKYKNGEEIITDTKALKLTQLAFDAVKNRNQEHYDSFYAGEEEFDDENDNKNESDIKQELADKCFISIKKLPKNNTVFRKKILEEC